MWRLTMASMCCLQAFGSQLISAEKPAYAPDSANLTIANGTVQAHDFALKTGLLSSDPAALEVTLTWAIKRRCP